MTKNKLLLVSVLSSVGIVGVAAAQGDGAEHFKKLDTNGDGVVTTAELTAGALERWTRSDTNKDGKVTADEAKAQLATHKQEMFGKRDANGDGKLTKDETGKMPEARFTALDTDKDGALSVSELEAGHPGMRGKHHGHEGKLPGDVNGDGAITKEEASAGAEQMAKKLDADGDGKITKAELARGHHAFAKHHGGRVAPVKAPAGDAG
jgi:Ca2+-binding EF-hand superfamily protein